MATGDRKVNIFVNRLLSKTALKEQFLEYLSKKLDETIAAFFQNESGVMDQDQIGLTADGNDKFKLVLTQANRVAVGTGQTITIPDETDVSKAIKFENALGVTYYVGVRYAETPWQLVDVNPKYGNPEYPSIEDSLGELAAPDLVTDTPGVKIALRINSITEAGVDHSGRTVKVWLVTPASGVAGTAYYSGTSYYSGGHNYVDIPYSGGNGPLGQDTSSGPPSTTPGDYRVFIKGVTWKRNTDLRLNNAYAFIGTVTGVGAGSPPAAFNLTDQNAIFLFTLDKGYDGAGAGLGRKINLDAGAVELNTGALDPGDHMKGMLRLDRTGSYEWAQFMLQLICGDVSSIPIACLQALRDGANLQENEPITCTGTVINFTRVGVDLQDLALRLNPAIQILLISSANVAADNGLYLIYSIPGPAGMVLRKLDGSLVSFTATTGLATVLHPLQVFSNSLPFALTGSGVADYWTGFLMTLRSGELQNRYINILPEKGGVITLWDGGKSAPATYPDDIRPRELLSIDPDLVGQANKYPFKFRRGMVVRGGNVSGGTGEESFYARDGVRIWDAGGPFEDRDTMFPFAVDYGFPEDVPTYHTWPVFALETSGAMDRGHHFRDDFMVHPPGIFTSLPYPSYYTYFPTARGDAYVRDINDGAGYGHGCIELRTGNVASDVAEFGLDAYPFNLDGSYDFRWCYRARLKMSSIADFKVVHGFYRSSVNRRFYFIWNYVDNEYAWRGGWLNPDLTWHVTDPICGGSVDKYQWFEIFISGNSVFFTIERKDHAANSYGSDLASITSLSGQAGGLGINLWTQTQAAAVKTTTLDYWEVWDREAMVGRHGTSHNLAHP